MADVKITLKKSLIGCKKPQIATAEALGLHKVGDVVTQPDNAQTAGKINKIIHLVEVSKS
ncbi:MAG: 50S ribosomal protein L30 [Clostridia bacterium]|nr:50S ribosomal protein L30 [Clostridia bacterium]